MDTSLRFKFLSNLLNSINSMSKAPTVTTVTQFTHPTVTQFLYVAVIAVKLDIAVACYTYYACLYLFC